MQKAQIFWQKLGTLNAAQLVELEKALAQPTAVKKSRPFYWLGAMVLPALACWLLVMPLWQSYFADYRTSPGEQQAILLSDGSRVLLNTASALSVTFSADCRCVVLHGGEAHFQVAKDTSRPFEVITEDGTVRALGTAFDVRQTDEDMTVTVSEHAVRVTNKQGGVIEQLTEGEQARINNQKISPIETVNLRQAMAWQQQRLVFKNQPLQQVVAELSRYRNGAIVITNKTLAQHQVTGVFAANDTETALKTTAKSLRLKEYRLTDRLVLLTTP